MRDTSVNMPSFTEDGRLVFRKIRIVAEAPKKEDLMLCRLSERLLIRTREVILKNLREKKP